MSDRLPPVQTNHLFQELSTELITLLRTLSRDSWEKPTCYPHWTVHDIAAHMLQTGISRLSAQRDGYRRDSELPESDGYESLSERIDAANTLWTDTLSSVSPRVLVDLLRETESQLASFFRHMPIDSRSAIGVAWAGEKQSATWFDVAREFSERWHHQQQIRDAVGAPDITKPEYLRPVLSTLIRAVPYWYTNLKTSEGSTVRIHIEGESGGQWQLQYRSERWTLSRNNQRIQANATVMMSEDTAWRFLTRTIVTEQAMPLIKLAGEETLSRQFLNVVAIMIPEHLR